MAFSGRYKSSRSASTFNDALSASISLDRAQGVKMANREGQICDAVVRQLEENMGNKRSNVEHPERAGGQGAVGGSKMDQNECRQKLPLWHGSVIAVVMLLPSRPRTTCTFSRTDVRACAKYKESFQTQIFLSAKSPI